LANKVKADLFICIHLNSAVNHDAYGTSTYVLGLHRTDDNLEVAKRENGVIDLEEGNNKSYEFDPNSPEGHIIMSMKQNAFLDQSILIASKIEDELAALAKRKSRGVKQAGFWVLYKTAMPSLLAEIGFISNPTEEQYLASSAGQTNIANAVFKAFKSYKTVIETGEDSPNPTAQLKDTSNVKAPLSKETTIGKSVEAKVEPKKPVSNSAVIAKETKPVGEKKAEPIAQPQSIPSTDKIMFTVQLIAARRLPSDYPKLVDLFGIINREDVGNGVVRYMAGRTEHFTDAKKILKMAMVSGFPEAFIICYVNGVRQSTPKTLELGNQNP
jgi:hypothetical protein